jgi:hypothetical protein
MIQRRVLPVHRHHDDHKSIEAAWRRVPIEHPFQHAVFVFGILLWKTIIIGVCVGMITGGLWLMIALTKAVIS